MIMNAIPELTENQKHSLGLHEALKFLLYLAISKVIFSFHSSDIIENAKVYYEMFSILLLICTVAMAVNAVCK
jgi:hypothetical protein